MTKSDCCCDSMETVLIDVIRDIKPDALLDDVGPEELERLADRLMDGAGGPRELGDALRMFFALKAGDAAAALAAVRRRAHRLKGAEFVKAAEPEIAGLVEALNGFCQAKTGLPFHIAAATGRFVPDEELDRRHRPLRDRLFVGMLDRSVDPKPAAAKMALAGCPSGQFPRYVHAQKPWQLSNSFSIRAYSRPQDVGCHYRHGPFPGTIKGWLTFSGHVALMISLQGWGGALAANNDHLFYKWWGVAAAGLSPYQLHLLLMIRRN